jgi:hypothetical protein
MKRRVNGQVCDKRTGGGALVRGSRMHLARGNREVPWVTWRIPSGGRSKKPLRAKDAAAEEKRDVQERPTAPSRSNTTPAFSRSSRGGEQHTAA